MKTAQLKNGLLEIRFSYDPAVVAQVRTLPPGRRWDPVNRAWTCPASKEAIEKLRGWGFSIDPAAMRPPPAPEAPPAVPSGSIPGLRSTLFPFQERGVGFLQKRKGRALLADEMGLGKTIQALAWLQLNPEAHPAVVVCPASLKGNWEQETLRHTSLLPRVLNGSRADRSQLGGDILVINYDILSKWLPLLEGLGTVVLDESHFIKNMKTKRAKAVRALAKRARHIIAISGTPIVNRPFEFFTTLNLIAPQEYPSYWDYVQRYCDARHNGFGWDLTGASNTNELYARVNGKIMIRRMKKEVLTDLPDKTRSILPMTPNEESMRTYEDALRDVQEKLDTDDTSPLANVAHIAKLRQAAVSAKLPDCLEWMDSFLESGKKLVVFVIHHSTSDVLRAHLSKQWRVRVLDGRVPVGERQAIVSDFQSPSGPQVLIGNVQVAGTGVTLTTATEALFMELPWTPGELTQAEDRLHRIGQKNAVTIYYAIAQGTLEEDMLKLLSSKKRVLDEVLDGIDKEQSAQNIITEMVKRVREAKRKQHKQ